MTRQIKRTKKGRFAKGTRGGPGRRLRKDTPAPTSQEIRDAFYKTFVQIFVKSGNVKELVAFCKKNQMNMRLLIQEVRKMLPEIAAEREGQSNVVFVTTALPRPEPKKEKKYEPQVNHPSIEEPEKEKEEKTTRLELEVKRGAEESKKKKKGERPRRAEYDPLMDYTGNELLNILEGKPKGFK